MKTTIKLSRADSLRREFIIKGSIARVIPYVCIPLAVYQGFNQLFRVVDNIMAAHISSKSVSAVAYLTQINQILLAIGAGLAVGSSILVSRYYGAGDYKRVKDLVNTLFALCAVMSVFVLAMIPFARPILLFFGTPENLITEGIGFFIISLINIVVIFYNNIYISIERAMGNSKRILKLNSLCIVVKFALTGFFVYVLNTGIEMIAVAGIIANLFILLPGLYFLIQNKSLFSLKISKKSFSSYNVKPILGLSYPVMTEKIAFSGGKIAVNSMSTGYGSLTVGALGITNNISGFVTSLQNGFQEGCSSVISQNLGAKNTNRALQSFRVTLLWNLLIGIVGYSLTMYFLPQIASLFSPTDKSFALMIEKIYRWEASGIIPLSINASAIALLYGFGYTKLTLIINFCRVLVFRVPLLFILQRFTNIGIQSVGIVMMTSNILVSILSGTIALVLYIRIYRKQISTATFTHILVGKRGKDNFSNLQEALDHIASLPLCNEALISLGEGVYEGQFYFDGYREEQGLSNISLRIKGKGKNKTILTGSLCASMIMKNGEKRGTFRSYTAFFSGPSVVLENLRIENTSGLLTDKGREAEQAIALYADSAYMYCKRVDLYGHQDTLFMSPLPKEERIKGGFTGPRVDNRRMPTIQIYKYCTIAGTIDFIFGGAGAFLYKTNILIRPLLPRKNENFEAKDSCSDQKKEKVLFIAAPCADAPKEKESGAEQNGLVFYKCHIKKTRESHTEEQNSIVYLARPWRSFARCSYIKCNFGKMVCSKKWDNWNNTENEKTAFFAEYKNKGHKNIATEQPEAKHNNEFPFTLTKADVKNIISQFKAFI